MKLPNVAAPVQRGDRFMLLESIKTPDAVIPPGSKGTVDETKRLMLRGNVWTALVTWDKGGCSLLILPSDKIKVLKRKEN